MPDGFVCQTHARTLTACPWFSSLIGLTAIFVFLTHCLLRFYISKVLCVIILYLKPLAKIASSSFLPILPYHSKQPLDTCPLRQQGDEKCLLLLLDDGKEVLVDFRDIEAFGENSAVVMGVASPSYICKTLDGGQTW